MAKPTIPQTNDEVVRDMLSHWKERRPKASDVNLAGARTPEEIRARFKDSKDLEARLKATEGPQASSVKRLEALENDPLLDTLEEKPKSLISDESEEATVREQTTAYQNFLAHTIAREIAEYSRQGLRVVVDAVSSLVKGKKETEPKLALRVVFPDHVYGVDREKYGNLASQLLEYASIPHNGHRSAECIENKLPRDKQMDFATGDRIELSSEARSHALSILTLVAVPQKDQKMQDSRVAALINAIIEEPGMTHEKMTIKPDADKTWPNLKSQKTAHRLGEIERVNARVGGSAETVLKNYCQRIVEVWQAVKSAPEKDAADVEAARATLVKANEAVTVAAASGDDAAQKKAESDQYWSEWEVKRFEWVQTHRKELLKDIQPYLREHKTAKPPGNAPQGDEQQGGDSQDYKPKTYPVLCLPLVGGNAENEAVLKALKIRYGAGRVAYVDNSPKRHFVEILGKEPLPEGKKTSMMDIAYTQFPELTGWIFRNPAAKGRE